MSIKFSKKILLTGAGFTADFGGYLATEMWSKIFNNENLRNFPDIKNVLRNQHDFEFVYWSITRTPTYSQDEKRALQMAIVQAYASMDINISFNLKNAFLGNLFNIFRGNASVVTPHFTLNQDLFLERSSHRIAYGLRIPEYKPYVDEINTTPRTINNITLPSPELLKKIQDQYVSSAGSEAYIKLHGSTGWISHDGSNVIVIGHEKTKGITSEPILKWYFELFKQAINAGNAKILIIGYGFRDAHINIELAKAVLLSELKIYIVSPSEPIKIKNQVTAQYNDQDGTTLDCSHIWQGIEGYYPYKIKELFPFDGSTPNAQRELLSNFT